MKKMMMTLIALLTMSAAANAMSYEQACNEALFLTDKMAYELDLTDEQYEAAYEINLDYLMGVTSPDDVYGIYWERRNLDMSYILYSWQWEAFRAASYFFRPLYWNAGRWHFGIYARYTVRDYFYFGRPHFYVSYRGGHSWHANGGRSYYYGRRDHFRPAINDRYQHYGMRQRFDNNRGYRPGSSTRITAGNRDRNDRYRPGIGNDRNRRFGGNRPNTNNDRNGNYGNNRDNNHNGNYGNNRDNNHNGNYGNDRPNTGNRNFGNDRPNTGNRNFGNDRPNTGNRQNFNTGSTPSTTTLPSTPSRHFGNSGTTTTRPTTTTPSRPTTTTTRPTTTTPSTPTRSFGGSRSSSISSTRSSSTPSRSFSSSSSSSSRSFGSSHSSSSRSSASSSHSSSGGSRSHFGGSRR